MISKDSFLRLFIKSRYCFVKGCSLHTIIPHYNPITYVNAVKHVFISLPSDKFLDRPKLKAFADDKFNVA